jgi:uncharacterized membrane protein
MNLSHIITNNTGLLHLLVSISALVFGTLVLATKKGTTRHRKMGYMYVTSIPQIFVDDKYFGDLVTLREYYNILTVKGNTP